MSVVTGALGSLSGKLLQLLHDEYKLQKGVRKQVQWLHSELESIHAFLRKVSDVPWDRLDKQLKLWAREVREASYDMEDALDTFLVRVDSSGGESRDHNSIKRTMKNVGSVFSKAKARRDIAGVVEDIKKHLDEVAERRQKYRLDLLMCQPLATTTPGIDPRLTAMYKEVAQLIGVEKSRDELIAMLNHPSSQPDDEAHGKKIIKRVSIVGVGGLGKTTLARAAYEKLKSQFDYMAFVSVGRDLDLVKVFKDILFQLDKDKYQNIHNTGRGVDLLISELREFLKNKRYFVVVDDVWELQTWRRIKPALVENNCGSKVMATTRKFDVAEEAGEVYRLKPLSYDDSMKLFYTRISGANGKYLDNQPDDVSRKCLAKCAGIPLAIITMTSLLVGKLEYEWSEVYNSFGFGHEDNGEVEDTMIILSFSYYDMPPHLRTCLLYLSTYPEDYLIEKDPLIWKWIAEGFVNGKQGTRLFEIGERYFNDIINRSLIQVVENDWDGTISGCRVHDMVLDLLRQISFEENFVALLGGNNFEGTPAASNVRRLAHQKTVAEHINSEAMVIGMPKVRSYTTFMCFIDNRDQFLRFKLLSVLDIVECNFKEGFHLEHLGNLLHLRYLGIRRCDDILELPKQIGNLKLLQTLDVDVDGTLPASIVQLTKLVRLCAKQAYAPDGIGKLTSLEELRICVSPDRFMKELVSLQELRVLEFPTAGMDESLQRDFVESLQKLKKIQHIRVRGILSRADTAVWEASGFVLPRPLCYLDLFTHFSKLPSCINPTSLPNLSHMTLRVNTMDEQDMKLLARLPSLCFLDLVTQSTITASNINAGDGCFFQKLRYFLVNKMVQFEQPNEEDASSFSLHIWNGEDAMPFGYEKSNDCSKDVPCGVMPNLEVLRFFVPLQALKYNSCDYGNIGIEYLPCLRELSGLVDCHGVSAAEVDAALGALRNACKVHPSHPMLDMDKINEAKDNNVYT